MPFIEYANGYISKWDDTISVGQLISTYYSGYFILERIEFVDVKHITNIVSSDTDEFQAPIFHFVKVLNADGTKSKQIKKSCSSIYCKKITKTWLEFNHAIELAAIEFKRNSILEYI